MCNTKPTQGPDDIQTLNTTGTSDSTTSMTKSNEISSSSPIAAATADTMGTPSSSSVLTSRRPPPLDPLQRVAVVRMNLFVLVRILFQYLERVDKAVLVLAKEVSLMRGCAHTTFKWDVFYSILCLLHLCQIQVLRDCERKHQSKDSKYATLADAINERLRDAVGETHWTQARKIQKQLMINQQKKKLKELKQKTVEVAQQRQRQEMLAADAMSTTSGTSTTRYSQWKKHYDTLTSIDEVTNRKKS